MTEDQPVGYSRLHDFIAKATPDQMRSKLFNLADKEIDWIERLKEKDEKIHALEKQVEQFYTTGVLEVESIRVDNVNKKRAKLGGDAAWSVFERSIYEGLFRIMRRKLQTRSASATDCQWLASALSHHVYRTLEKFNLVAHEKTDGKAN